MWISENFYGKLSRSQIIGSKTENCQAGKNIRKVLVNIYEWALKKWKKWMWTPILNAVSWLVYFLLIQTNRPPPLTGFSKDLYMNIFPYGVGYWVVCINYLPLCFSLRRKRVTLFLWKIHFPISKFWHFYTEMGHTSWDTNQLLLQKLDQNTSWDGSQLFLGGHRCLIWRDKPCSLTPLGPCVSLTTYNQSAR